MMTNKKLIFGIIVIIVLLIIGIILFASNMPSFGPTGRISIKTMACDDHPNNASGKHGIPIPCSVDSDCDLSDENVIASMKEFCSPAEVGFYECGFKDFCGDDGYCKHDCSLGAR
jgi:hypothetical protein